MDLDPVQDVIAALEATLLSHEKTSVTVTKVQQISKEGRRNLLLRVTLTHPNDSCVLPKTMIAKRVVPRKSKQADDDAVVETSRFNPDDVKSFDTLRFFGDWAGAEFLHKMGFASAPRFYGGHRAMGFILLQDLGNDHGTMVEPLLKQFHFHRSHAEAVLLKFAVQLGQMHAKTLGKTEEFQKLQNTLHPELATKSTAIHRRPFPLEEDVARQLASVLGPDFQLTTHAKEEFQKITKNVVNAPGPFTAFIHNDPCPDNFVLRDKDGELTLHILDFEFGRMGHCLNDVLYARMIFPSCWCCNRIPRDVIVQMEAAYRNELSLSCEEARDEARFYEELTIVCGYWMLRMIPHIEYAVKEEKDTEWGIASRRPRILSRLDAFIDTVDEFGHLPALRDVADQLRTHLQEKWSGTERLPLYPAFC